MAEHRQSLSMAELPLFDMGDDNPLAQLHIPPIPKDTSSESCKVSPAIFSSIAVVAYDAYRVRLSPQDTAADRVATLVADRSRLRIFDSRRTAPRCSFRFGKPAQQRSHQQCKGYRGGTEQQGHAQNAHTCGKRSGPILCLSPLPTRFSDNITRLPGLEPGRGANACAATDQETFHNRLNVPLGMSRSMLKPD